MTGEKWMTSGRARLKARQNRTFAQRASLGRTRNRSNRTIVPSSEAKRHPSYNKQNTTGLTGTYSAWADPIARRAVVATVGNEGSRSENGVNAEYPPGTVVASERPQRKIRDANRWNTIRRPLARSTSSAPASFRPSYTMYQQREVSPPFAYQQGRHPPMAGPPMQQPHDPMSGFTNEREDPNSRLQSHYHHQYVPPSRNEMYTNEQDRYASLHPYDQPQFGMGNYSAPDALQRKAYYQSHSFESAWGSDLVPAQMIPVPEQLQSPMVGHSSVPSQWYQGYPPEHGRGGFARFQKRPRSLNLEQGGSKEYDLQMDYQQYDNNDLPSPPNAGFNNGEPFSVQEDPSNVNAPFAQSSQGNVPPFSGQNSHMRGVPPFSTQNSHTGVPLFASKQVRRDTPFNSSRVAQSHPLNHNQEDFDDFEAPLNPTRPLQPKHPAGHRNGFGFFSTDHHRHHQPIDENAGEPFVSPESQFGIPPEQNQQRPFQQTRQRQFLNAREERNVMDEFAPFDEPLQMNDEAATRGIPIFKGRSSASQPAQPAVEQRAQQPAALPNIIPSQKQEDNVETSVATKELSQKYENSSEALAKQKPSKKEPEKRNDSGNQPIEFFQAWKGASLNSSERDNPQNQVSMISTSLAKNKQPQNKKNQTSLQNHTENNLERVVLAEQKECYPQGRAQSDDDSVDDGRRPYGSRLPIRFFNEGIEIDEHGRPLAPKQKTIKQAGRTSKKGNHPSIESPNSDSLDGVQWNGKSSLWA